MSVRVNAFQRGGFGTYGRSWYDQRLGAVMVQGEEGDEIPITAVMPSAINTVNYDVTGALTTSEPVISGSQFTATLSSFQESSRVRYDVLLASGETIKLHMGISGAGRATRFPSASGDYGAFD